MANLRYTLAGINLDPALEGLSRRRAPIRETLGMAAGNNRHYRRPVPRRFSWTLTYPGADEATWAEWKAAADAAELGATFVEPDGSTHTVILVGFDDPISDKTITAGADTWAAVGTVERDLTLELETL